MDRKRRPDDDVSLLAQIRLRKDGALLCLYDRYAGTVYSIALRILHDRAPAEQALSDIFLDIWRHPGRFGQVTGSLLVPLVMIARNRALSVLLHKSSEADFAVPGWAVSHPATHVTREQACAAMEKLPVEQRNRLEKAFFEGATKSGLEQPGKNPAAPKEGLLTSIAVSRLAGTGLEVIDVASDPAFARRHLHVRDTVLHLQGMNRLARLFAENSSTILQELVTAAVELCGADSAGISVVQENSTDEDYYHWVATAGEYSGFLHAKLPRYPSACGVTLERARPQIFRVSQRFFDLMGIQAPTVTDGLLLPWQVEETRGTIWIMAHGRLEAFDTEDCNVMQVLANFAATGVRLQQQQKILLEQARAAGETAMAKSIAQQIHSPLRELMQSVYLLARKGRESDACSSQLMAELVKLSKVLNQLPTTHEGPN